VVQADKLPIAVCCAVGLGAIDVVRARAALGPALQVELRPESGTVQVSREIDKTEQTLSSFSCQLSSRKTA